MFSSQFSELHILSIILPIHPWGSKTVSLSIKNIFLICAGPQRQQVCSQLRAFALAIPFAWNSFLLLAYTSRSLLPCLLSETFPDHPCKKTAPTLLLFLLCSIFLYSMCHPLTYCTQSLLVMFVYCLPLPIQMEASWKHRLFICTYCCNLGS